MPKKSRAPLKSREVIDAAAIAQALGDLSRYILSRFDFSKGETALVGIHRRGAVIAERLAERIQKEKHLEVPIGALDITLYRDDFSTIGVTPIIGETHLDFDIDGKTIVLIDDVLFTGRTIRAALDELMDYGRPQTIALAVLVDRGHRELPIQPDFAAITVKTDKSETVNLHLKEVDEKEEIVIGEALP